MGKETLLKVKTAEILKMKSDGWSAVRGMRNNKRIVILFFHLLDD